eukprot:8499398-Ditylum_brightwellii.AAC.1
MQKKSLKFKYKLSFASETSLRMVTSYIKAVAASHLILGEPPEGHPTTFRFGTEVSKLLAELVCNVEGVDLACVTSTDDTVLFITDEEDEKETVSINLTLRNTGSSSRNMKSKNYYVCGEKTNKMGIQVKFTYAFSANGNTA